LAAVVDYTLAIVLKKFNSVKHSPKIQKRNELAYDPDDGRRVPARLFYNGQIKQLVNILKNSLEMRHAAKHRSRTLKDDRNILQLISAKIQVAKILKDASAMEYLDNLYITTEQQIQERIALHRYRS
jgi:hypothetical protein